MAIDEVVTILSTCIHYRAAITEDCTIILDFAQIQPTSDLVFDLELIADNDYDVIFVVTGISATLEWETPLLVATRGISVVEFSKKIGFPILKGNLKKSPYFY